jgi:hypothetical protein
MEKQPPRKVKVRRTWVGKAVFDDGSVMTTEPMEHDELALRWLHDAAILFCSDEPARRIRGAEMLKTASKVLAKAEAATWNASSAAALGRAKDPLRQRILDMMRPEKAGRTAFKTFLRRWESEQIDRLELRHVGEAGYAVSDGDGDGGESAYTFDSLKTMYSGSDKSKRQRR